MFWGFGCVHLLRPFSSVQFSSVAQSCPTLCNPMNRSIPRPPCPSPTPGVQPDSRPSSPWWHPAISSSVVPFSSCPQSLPPSESFPVSQMTEQLIWSDVFISMCETSAHYIYRVVHCSLTTYLRTRSLYLLTTFIQSPLPFVKKEKQLLETAK